MKVFARSTGYIKQASMVVLGAGLGIFLGWLAVRGTDWDRVRNALGDFPSAMLALALALLLLSFWLRAMRWRLLWTTHKVRTLRLFLVENAALGLNNISPIRALDEPLELGILVLRDRLPGGTVVATMVMSRMQDLAFTILFVAVAVASLPVLLRFTPAFAFGALWLVAWLAILLNLGRIVKRFPALGRLPGVASFEEALKDMWRRKRRVAMAFALTCSYWLLLAPIGWVIADGVGIDLALHKVMFTVLGSIFFATAVPGLPSAIGTFEFAVVSLLDLFGISQEPAITFAIIVHAVLFLPPTVFTIFVLPREGMGSIGALRSTLRRGREAQRG